MSRAIRVMRASPERRILGGASGLLVGVLAGAIVGLAASGPGGARQATPSLTPFIDATHLPPLLTTGAGPVDLRYEVFCSAGGDEDVADSAPCNASGIVYVREGDSGWFAPFPLHVDPSAPEGRYVASVPSDIARSPAGFSYYATFRSEPGAVITLPSGGAAAPDRSLPLGRSIDVHLGAHVFGATRKPDDVVAHARWGDGPDEIGLEQGRNLTPLGGSSFDVDRSGRVVVLDEAHRRLLRWSDGRLDARLPLAIDGTLADLTLGADGRVYVLESTGPARNPLLREFSSDGASLGSVEAAERAAEIRPGPHGPVMLQEPSNQWTEAEDGGHLLSADEQRKRGRVARLLPGGGSVVLLRAGDEIRAALESRDGVRRSWRVTSETPFAEVQLAEARGNNLVLVARVYTDVQDEFVVLVLGPRGLDRSFSLDSDDWAETAPLARFRLVGSALYQLGSTANGVFVNRFDLEGQ